MINVIFCGYRFWALEIIKYFENSSNIKIVSIFNNNEEIVNNINSINDKVDVVVFLGWSWFISNNILEKYFCVGIHPSDLPNYRGGSPLQHQIINGIEYTKISLMQISSEGIDKGDIWDKEELCLNGDSMEIIFKNLTISSIILLNRFFHNFDNKKSYKQDIESGLYFDRRKPEESKILKEFFYNKSLKEIYNFIRALTYPYPNAYIEDEKGNKLLFEKVKYIEKGNDESIKD
ncbi:MAG: formyltransferase family protein [Eubacteriales bacterium]|nr:formyltransferase family protein [Eubacteriales bacterium]